MKVSLRFSFFHHISFIDSEFLYFIILKEKMTRVWHSKFNRRRGCLLEEIWYLSWKCWEGSMATEYHLITLFVVITFSIHLRRNIFFDYSFESCVTADLLTVVAHRSARAFYMTGCYWRSLALDIVKSVWQNLW